MNNNEKDHVNVIEALNNWINSLTVGDHKIAILESIGDRLTANCIKGDE